MKYYLAYVATYVKGNAKHWMNINISNCEIQPRIEPRRPRMNVSVSTPTYWRQYSTTLAREKFLFDVLYVLFLEEFEVILMLEADELLSEKGTFTFFLVRVVRQDGSDI